MDCPTCTLRGQNGETYQLPQLIDLPAEFLERPTLVGGVRGGKGSVENVAKLMGDACPHSAFANEEYDPDSIRSVLESQTVCSDCKLCRAKHTWLEMNRPVLAVSVCEHGDQARKRYEQSRLSIFQTPPDRECQDCHDKREAELRRQGMMVCPHCAGQGWHNATRLADKGKDIRLAYMDFFLSIILPVSFLGLIIGLFGTITDQSMLAFLGLGTGAASALVLVFWSFWASKGSGITAGAEFTVEVDLRHEEDCPTCRGQCLVPAEWTRSWRGWGIWRFPSGWQAKISVPDWIYKAP